MKVVDGERYYSVREAGELIKRRSSTIKNWYKWAEMVDAETLAQVPELPMPRTDLDPHRTRYYTESQVLRLKTFRDSITYGLMAEFNREKWSKTKN